MTKSRWVAGAAALAAVALLGLAVGRSTADDDDTGPVRTGRMTIMEHSGELHVMLQQHQDMMSQMQASLSPQMLEMMRTDPMWRMLDSGELIRLMEEHQGDLDRMLAR